MKLTDDEVVALAVRSASVWASPLPTVDLDEPADVASAARRGERSLYARGLLQIGDADLGALDDELEELLRPAQHRDALVSVFVADGEMNWHVGGPNLVCYGRGSADGVLLETVSEAGVHSFAVVDEAFARGTVLELATAALSGGIRRPGAQDATESLCLSRPASEGVETVQIEKGAAFLQASNGRTPLRPEEAERWIARLFEGSPS